MMNDPQVLIDEVTGEVIEQDYTPDYLPAIGRTIRALQRKAGDIGSYRKAEVNRINEICNDRVERLQAQIAHFMDIAKQLTGDKKRLEYPGIGVFRFRKLPPKSDRSEWDSFTPDQQKAVAASMPNLFEVIEEVKPKTVEIKKALKDSEVPGWSLGYQSEKFEFKEES
jgi:hypothetical protein